MCRLRPKLATIRTATLLPTTAPALPKAAPAVLSTGNVFLTASATSSKKTTMSATRAQTRTGMIRTAQTFVPTVSNSNRSYSISLDSANCVVDGTAAGNEAILLCDSSDETSWCCDANRVAYNCCTKSGATTFSLPFGTQVAMIGLGRLR